MVERPVDLQVFSTHAESAVTANRRHVTPAHSGGARAEPGREHRCRCRMGEVAKGPVGPREVVRMAETLEQHLSRSHDLVGDLYRVRCSEIDVGHGVTADVMPPGQKRFEVIPRHQRLKAATAEGLIDAGLITDANQIWTHEEASRHTELVQHGRRVATTLEPVVEAERDIGTVERSMRYPLYRFAIADQPVFRGQPFQQTAEVAHVVARYTVAVEQVHSRTMERFNMSRPQTFPECESIKGSGANHVTTMDGSHWLFRCPVACTGRAGTPTAVTCAGRSLVATAPLPTTVPSPIVSP